MDYFIMRGESVHGPIPGRDIRDYIAYGSLKGEDLLRRGDEEEWFAARLFPEFEKDFAPPDAEGGQPMRKPPAHPARFRDYKHVPAEQRSGVVVWWLLSGFVCRPILFWKTAGSVFTELIYRRAKTEDGFLRTWPRWTEGAVMVLVLVHAVAWTAAAFWAVPRFKQAVQHVEQLVREEIEQAKKAL